MTFEATYDDESTGSVTPASCSPSVWGEAGTETITFSFAGTDVTCEVVGEAIAPVVVPTGVTITGTWTNDSQIANADIDYAGLTFTVNYSDGSHKDSSELGSNFRARGEAYKDTSDEWHFIGTWASLHDASDSSDRPVLAFHIKHGDPIEHFFFYVEAPAIDVVRMASNLPLTDTQSISIGEEEETSFIFPGCLSETDATNFKGFIFDTNTASHNYHTVSPGDVVSYVMVKSDYDLGNKSIGTSYGVDKADLDTLLTSIGGIADGHYICFDRDESIYLESLPQSGLTGDVVLN